MKLSHLKPIALVIATLVIGHTLSLPKYDVRLIPRATAKSLPSSKIDTLTENEQDAEGLRDNESEQDAVEPFDVQATEDEAPGQGISETEIEQPTGEGSFLLIEEGQADMLENGIRVLEDGTVIFPDGSKITADGEQLLPNGEVAEPTEQEAL